MVILGGSYLIISCVGTEGTSDPLSESAAKSTNLELGSIKSVVIFSASIFDFVRVLLLAFD